MSTEFGEADPEDAWDPDDPVVELLDNLRRRLVAIVAIHALDEAIKRRLGWLLDDLAHVLARVRARRLDSEH